MRETTTTDDGRLSPHFSLREFAVSATHPELVVPVPVRFRPMLQKLADTVLEPLRTGVGRPLHVLSGYRSARLNRAAGGSPTSQHLFGEAADLVPTDGTPASALFDWLRARARAGAPLPHGQVIWYPDRNFVHVALPSVRYAAPTFCLHWPARGYEYRVISAAQDMAHLLAPDR